MSLWARIKDWAIGLKTEVKAFYLAYGHPAVPWYAKVWIVCVVAYAVSPIDLIPDFIPILGYIDDLILLPLGIRIAVRMIPIEVMAECRIKAAEPIEIRGVVRWAMVPLIVLFWIGLASFLAWLIWSTE